MTANARAQSKYALLKPRKITAQNLIDFLHRERAIPPVRDGQRQPFLKLDRRVSRCD
jgi:hypothetical protein